IIKGPNRYCRKRCIIAGICPEQQMKSSQKRCTFAGFSSFQMILLKKPAQSQSLFLITAPVWRQPTIPIHPDRLRWREIFEHIWYDDDKNVSFFFYKNT
ncbi:hypothetical protein, partial [Paenibacillus alba]